MKTTFRLLTGACVASLLTASALLTPSAAMAHHSFAMFDRSVEKVATGTVARWAFNAPHSWLYLNIKNADGSETLWSFEGSAPPSLLTRGIIGWARLADGTFVNPADGGCDGSVKAIEKWKVWLAAGYTSSAEALKAK